MQYSLSPISQWAAMHKICCIASQRIVQTTPRSETAVLRVLSDILAAPWQGWFRRADTAWFFSSIWQGWPCHSAASPLDNLRYHLTWHRTGLVHFLPPLEKTVCPLQRIQLNSTTILQGRFLIGQILFFSVHGRFRTHRRNWAAFSKNADNAQIYGSCAPD